MESSYTINPLYNTRRSYILRNPLPNLRTTHSLQRYTRGKEAHPIIHQPLKPGLQHTTTNQQPPSLLAAAINSASLSTLQRRQLRRWLTKESVQRVRDAVEICYSLCRQSSTHTARSIQAIPSRRGITLGTIIGDLLIFTPTAKE